MKHRARLWIGGCVALLLAACDPPQGEAIDDGNPDLDDLTIVPRGGGDPLCTVRLLTANLEHVTWCNAMERNGMVEQAVCDIDDGKSPPPEPARLLAWLQVLYLQTLEGPGPTIFNLQESSVLMPRTGNVDWVRVLHLMLGASAVDPAYGDYASWYQPINGGVAGNNWGNAIVTNLDVNAYEEWNLDQAWTAADGSPVGEACNGEVSRAAHAAHVRVDGVDLWSVNVHLEFCKPEDQGGFEVNLCNFDNLLLRLDSLPTDEVVVVSGDFNIGQDARTNDSDACNGPVHPNRFMTMLGGFQDRQFMLLESTGVDHLFFRDPSFETSDVRTRVFDALYDPNEPGESGPPEDILDMSDHKFIETEVDVGGAGMSRAFLPMYVVLN